LRDAKMLWIDSNERLMPGFIKPDSEFQLGARDKGGEGLEELIRRAEPFL
jgi:hypothetical protein